MKLVFENKKRINEEVGITSMRTIMEYLEDGYELMYNYRPGWAYLYDPNAHYSSGIKVRYDVAEKFVDKYKDQLYRTKGAGSEYNFLFGLKEDLSESEKRMNEDAISSSAKKCEIELIDIMYSINRWMEKWVDYQDPEQLKGMALEAVEDAYGLLLDDLGNDD